MKEETEKSAAATFKKHEKEYRRLTSPDIFKPNVIEILNKTPLSQIWRDHLLSIATKQVYDEGFFVFLFPSENTQCQNGVNNYKNLLISDDEDQTGFYASHLEVFIKSLRSLHDVEWTIELQERYLGF